MSVKLKPHNVTGYDAVTEKFKKENKTALIRPTGTGKSFVALKLIEDNEGKKVIYLAPSRAILQQFRNNMKQNGIKYKDENNRKLVEEYTYQKLLSMLKNDELHLEADIIILDEFHHCGAPEWGSAVEELLRQNPNAKVLGLSATPIRYFDETIRDMAEELFGNSIADEMNIAEAIEQEILKEPVYTTGIYDSTEIIKEYEEKVDTCGNEEKKKIAEEYLKELRDALDENVQGLPELLASSMTNPQGKYVIFCKNIEDMQKKMAEAQKIFGKVNPQIELYSVSSAKYDNDGNKIGISEIENARQLKKFEKSTENGNLKLLFSVDMVNEGWHYSELDGAVMMRPTSSPTLFAQQLGRALDIGENKQPVIIDLVNNVDSIRVIENFYKKFGSGEKKNHSVLSEIKISKEMREVTEIIKKVDSLIQRKEYLTYEEKLELMLEYIKSIEGTDERFTADSQYKGYDLGSMRANMRANYWNGALKIDNELLQKFIEAGIIIEKPERIKTTAQEKYDFLISMIGKSKKNAKMESGLSYKDARAWIQHQYNFGKLDLQPEQVKVLKDNGILNLSANEIKELESEYGILSTRDIKNITNEYGNIDEFMEKFKRREIDYSFSPGTYVGAREIIVSERDLTVEQKKAYVDLAYEVFGMSKEDDIRRIIDIDKLEEKIQDFNDRYKETIIKRFGLDGKRHSYQEIGKLIGVTGGRIGQILSRIFREIRRPSCRVLICDRSMQEIDEEADKLKEEEKMLDAFEKLLIDMNEQGIDLHIHNDELAKLNLNLDEEQLKILQLCSEKEDGLSLNDLYERKLNIYMEEKHESEASKIYHERFTEIYSRLEEDYMENEDIFNPNSIIIGKKIEEIKEINWLSIKEEVEKNDVKVNTFPISTLGKAMIRQADTDYVYRTFQMFDGNQKEFIEALKKIEGLTLEDIEKIAYEKYSDDNKKEESKFRDNDSIYELALDIREMNVLIRGGIRTIGQLLSLYDTKEGWKYLKNIRHMGPRGCDKILKILEQEKLIYDGKPPISEDEEVVVDEYDNNTSVEKLAEGLSTRAYNYLIKARLKNIGDILALYDEEKGQIVFPKVRNTGDKTLQEILTVLEEKSFLQDGKPVEKIKEDDDLPIDNAVKDTFEPDEVDMDISEKEDNNTSVEKLAEELSTKAYNYLRRAGLENIGDILALYDEEKGQIVFPKVRNTGDKTLQEILTVLEEKSFLQDGKPVEKIKEDDDLPMDNAIQDTFELDEIDRDISEKEDSNNQNLEIDNSEDDYKLELEEEQQEELKEVDSSEEEVQTEADSKEIDINNEYQKLVLDIMECDTEYTEMQKNYEEINFKKETIKNKIDELINQIDETSNNSVNQAAAVNLMEAFKLLQEQRGVLKELEIKLEEMKEVEKANREKKKELTKSLTEIVRGGE